MRRHKKWYVIGHSKPSGISHSCYTLMSSSTHSSLSAPSTTHHSLLFKAMRKQKDAFNTNESWKASLLSIVIRTNKQTYAMTFVMYGFQFGFAAIVLAAVGENRRTFTFIWLFHAIFSLAIFHGARFSRWNLLAVGFGWLNWALLSFIFQFLLFFWHRDCQESILNSD